MAEITLRVLDGADRGRVFANLETPVTIGREDGNTIQLNDERVSRFHIKVQEDQEKIVLTDLDSTNGTKVNGEEVQLRILRHGDVLAVGRTVMVYGSREQIAARLAALRGESPMAGTRGEEGSDSALRSLDFELHWNTATDHRSPLHVPLPPELPERLSPGQAAQLSELLEYLHLRLRELIASVEAKTEKERLTIEARHWQNLVDLQAKLASWQRAIAHGESE